MTEAPTIKDVEKHSFMELCNGRYQYYSLFDCIVNGEKGTAICHIDVPDSDHPRITPIWVSVGGLDVKDEHGRSFS